MASRMLAVRFMVAAQRYEDLDAWKLCAELRDEIFRLTQSGPVTGDSKFREQIRDSSSSAQRNIAEGFGRFKPRPFAYFVRISTRIARGDPEPRSGRARERLLLGR
jgi:hypothetical protein